MKIRHILSPQLGRISADLQHRAVSGIAGAAVYSALEQVRAGYQVELWGWSPHESAQTFVFKHLHVRLIPNWQHAKIKGVDVRWFAPFLIQSLLAKSVDILHVHVELGMLRLPGAKKYVLHLQTPLPDPLSQSFVKLYHKADAIICPSAYIKYKFQERISYSPEQLFVVHNAGGDLEGNIEATNSKVRSELDIPQEAVMLLFASALVKNKGAHYLLEGFKKIVSTRPHVYLIIAGGSNLWNQKSGSLQRNDYERNLQDIAQGLPVQFLGTVEHTRVLELMQACDLFILPSNWPDPHPLAISEAMAAGKAVVASRVGGIPETVLDEHTGLLVPAGDVDALAQAIIRLVDDKNLRARMGLAGKERSKLFTWQKAAEKQLQIYHALLEEKRYS
jgi:glycosyltransferase involved in cell wall biosynthesis